MSKKRKQKKLHWQIVDTDNFNGDYPDEKVFIGNLPTQALAERIAEAINNRFVSDHSPRFYKVTDSSYKLQPGFEP